MSTVVFSRYNHVKRKEWIFIDIYITDLETNDKFRFPMLPEKINIQAGTTFQSYTIMSTGEIKFPSGESLFTFSWKGMLPGEARKKSPYVREWKAPKEIQNLWNVYKTKQKKLKLLITETPVNHDVYLDNYSIEYGNGYGDCDYQISFLHAKELKIYKDGESDGKTTASENSRPSPPKSKTYTVKSGDTLWGIAQKELGAGAKYTVIHAANQPPLGSDPHKIYPGQVLTIPT